MTIRIHAIQGTGLKSPISGQTVSTQGVVIGHGRRGFYIQDPAGSDDPAASDGLFVYSPKGQAPIGYLVEIDGEVVDFQINENDRPSTQLRLDEIRLIDGSGPEIEPVWLTAENIPDRRDELAMYLNGLEGMLVGIESGATFIAPSNPFGDYMVAPVGDPAEFNRHGGLLLNHADPHRWYPGFRIKDYDIAPMLHVGAKLLEAVVGPLNYRGASYQLVVRNPIKVEHASVEPSKSTLEPVDGSLTILTLNGFNLDEQLESRHRVKNPRRDIDDDLKDGRFHSLALAVVEQALAPDIVALQEIQDNDGAEMTDVVDASETYGELIKAIRKVGGPDYHWIDIPPEDDADGGQPGGNIRNAFLYNPKRVELIKLSVAVLGVDDPSYINSRKPLIARFKEKASGKELTIINVHLASKRDQFSIFAPENPGVDPRTPIRVRQAEIVRGAILDQIEQGIDYYVTGDFNDVETSATIKTLLGKESANLVELLPPGERFDYNHRGKLQVLMHGIVSKKLLGEGRAEYEIIHGNELIGVQPGEMGSKPTDHAYVIARLSL